MGFTNFFLTLKFSIYSIAMDNYQSMFRCSLMLEQLYVSMNTCQVGFGVTSLKFAVNIFICIIWGIQANKQLCFQAFVTCFVDSNWLDNLIVESIECTQDL